MMCPSTLRISPTMNDRQRAFCQYYAADPDGTAAAIKAGYSRRTAAAIASENLRKPELIEYIKELQAEAEAARVASITEVKQFWSAVMRDDEQRIEARLQASQLLAKSSGELIQKVDVSAQVEATVEQDVDVVFYIPDNGRAIIQEENDE